MNETEDTPWDIRTAPWVTLVAVCAAIAIFLWPAAAAALEYDRALIQSGQWWRILTANWVHFSGRELGWNVAVLLPAGIWAERVLPVRARVLYLVAPAVIGAVVFFFVPEIIRFAGLSGVAAGMVAFLAVAQLSLTDKDRWFWRVVIVLLALKVAAEAMLASRWFAHVSDPAARAVPLIHLAGIAAGAFVLSARRRRKSAS